MAVEDQLDLSQGDWVVVNCGSMSSESHCQLVIMAPEDQEDDLVDAATQHAVSKHGHQGSDQLRNDVSGQVRKIEVK